MPQVDESELRDLHFHWPLHVAHSAQHPFSRRAASLPCRSPPTFPLGSEAR